MVKHPSQTTHQSPPTPPQERHPALKMTLEKPSPSPLTASYENAQLNTPPPPNHLDLRIEKHPLRPLPPQQTHPSLHLSPLIHLKPPHRQSPLRSLKRMIPALTQASYHALGPAPSWMLDDTNLAGVGFVVGVVWGGVGGGGRETRHLRRWG